ncbi:XRE family transcriptional regulator [Candidatus Microgenomates bacterium]|nr:MAG: XRE family transcriptional regulator [Candidatus Microgenomates bacterium]
MEELSLKLKHKRGNRGIREVAKEIGISHATLSRIESGKQPDLETFTKICKWLEIDPNSILGFQKKQSIADSVSMPVAHFRAEKTMSTTTASHLAELILAVQKAALNKTS